MKSFRCNRCKQMFESDGMPPPLCPKCQEAKDTQFRQVRDLVKENKGITVVEVHDRTGVPITNILQYVKQGALEVMQGNSEEALIRTQRLMDETTQEPSAKDAHDSSPLDKEDKPEPEKNEKQRIKWIVPE